MNSASLRRARCAYTRAGTVCALYITPKLIDARHESFIYSTDYRDAATYIEEIERTRNARLVSVGLYASTFEIFLNFFAVLRRLLKNNFS